MDFLCLILMWLLPLTARGEVTSGHEQNSTNEYQEPSNETSTFNPLTEVSSHPITQSPIIDVDQMEEKTTDNRSKYSPQTAPTMPFQGFLTNKTAPTMPFQGFQTNNQTEETPTTSGTSRLTSSTVDEKTVTDTRFHVTTSAVSVATSQASVPSTTPVLRSSTRRIDAETTSTVQFTSDETTNPSTSPTGTTDVNSTAITFTKPGQNQSMTTSQVTGSPPATRFTVLYTTSMATSKAPLVPVTKPNPGKNIEATKGANHGKVVAGVIGGALILMMIGFLVIYIRQRKLREQQIMTTDWAGPSPFLEGGANNGQVTLRSSNRISFTSFLPQRLSKRMSLLPEMDEELKDMAPGTTFGHESDGNDVVEGNGTAIVDSKNKSTGEASETVENSVTGASPKANNPLSADNHSEVENLSQDHSANPPTIYQYNTAV